MQKISAVLIMKNEEVLLARCLDSIKGVDEIILCDTGSTDRSVEIGKRYTDKIVYFPWCDNFAKARNYAKSYATGDWILSIDCDEFLHDFSKVREAVEIAETRKALAVDVKMISEDYLKQVFFYPRLFKNSVQVFWEGAIHNHLSVLPINAGNVEITYGYSPAHNIDKDRAFRILKREVASTGNPREIFYLGREYYYRKDYENAILMFCQYIKKSDTVRVWLAEKAEVFLNLARAYWETKRGEEARQCLIQAIIINANFKEALIWMAEMAGEGSGNQKWEANARQWRKMAETADNNDVLFIRNT